MRVIDINACMYDVILNNSFDIFVQNKDKCINFIMIAITCNIQIKVQKWEAKQLSLAFIF